MTENRKPKAEPTIPEWQQVDANDMIQRLRDRISDLEYERDLQALQIRNLLRKLEGKAAGDATRQ